MNCTIRLLVGSLVLLPALGFAQSPGAAPSAPSVAAPIDPIFTTPAESLTPKQITTLQKLGSDFPQLARYRDANASVAAPAAGERRVVFYGDSITDAWGGRNNGSQFFPGKPYLNRGISGQTTAQMVVRFRQDVVELHPAAVLILAGTNDLAGNTGLSSMQMIEDNFRSMTEIAQANHIRVILASVLPVSEYPWRRGVHPAEQVRTLNAWMKQYAQEHGCIYVDYYSAMTNAEGGMDRTLASDGVHPTAAGYGIMAPLAEKGIQQAFAR